MLFKRRARRLARSFSYSRNEQGKRGGAAIICAALLVFSHDMATAKAAEAGNKGKTVQATTQTQSLDQEQKAALTKRWLERIDSAKAFATEELTADFLALDPIPPKEIWGTWRGGKFDGGASPDPINWYGKRFIDMETVQPLLVKAPDGSIGVFEKLGAARLREVFYKNKVSSTIIYNNQPIMDYFRKIDDDTIVGWGEVKGKSPDFFFWLKRDPS